MARVMAKLLIVINQVSLVRNPSETWRREHKSPELSLLKVLPLAYHHSHFLAATLYFVSFFTMASCTLSLHQGCFGLDNELSEGLLPNDRSP